MASSQQTPPAQLPANVGRVRPHLARHGEWQPTVGGFVVVDLGGETIRCTVTETFGENADAITVIIGTPDPLVPGKINGVVMDKANHGYKVGQEIGVTRAVDESTGAETWRPISARAVLEQETLQKFRQQQGAPPEAALPPPPHKVVMPQPALAQNPATVAPPDEPATNLPDEPESGTKGVSRETSEAPRKVLGPRRSKVTRQTEPTRKVIIGAADFGETVERIAILYRNCKDPDGLRIFARLNLGDVAIRLREMLIEQGKRDGWEIEVEHFDEMVNPVLRPGTASGNHPAAMFASILDVPSAIEGRE